MNIDIFYGSDSVLGFMDGFMIGIFVSMSVVSIFSYILNKVYPE